jgi:hypothetical protein
MSFILEVLKIGLTGLAALWIILIIYFLWTVITGLGNNDDDRLI